MIKVKEKNEQRLCWIEFILRADNSLTVQLTVPLRMAPCHLSVSIDTANVLSESALAALMAALIISRSVGSYEYLVSNRNSEQVMTP